MDDHNDELHYQCLAHQNLRPEILVIRY